MALRVVANAFKQHYNVGKMFRKDQAGFIPLLIVLFLLLAAVIVMVYLRVAHIRAGVSV